MTDGMAWTTGALAELGVERTQLQPGDRLVEDLGLDSLAAAELLALLEDSLGETLPNELVENLLTVGDVAHLVELRAGQATAGPASGPASGAASAAVPPDGPRLPTPTVEGRHVRLVTLEPQHAAALHLQMTDPSTGFRWRLRGAVPPPEHFTAILWENTLVSFVLEDVTSKATVGFVSCTSPDFRNGYAYLNAFVSPAVRGTGWAAEGVILFCEYLFQHFDLRKLYVESLDFNVPQFGSSIGRHLRVEGQLHEHEYYAGRFVDVVVMALYRDDFLNSPTRRAVISSSAS